MFIRLFDGWGNLGATNPTDGTEAIVPASKDPALRARQLANLRPNAAVRHGAHAAKDIEPLRVEHLARLRERFPSADDALLAIQAERAAQLDLISEYLGRRPGVGAVMRNRRTAVVWPAREYAAKLQSAYERQCERLEGQDREAGNASPHDELAAIVRELAESDDGGGEGDGEDG